MDSRTRLAIGGMATVAASIAVVCAVAMTTSTALVDSAGATVGARPVVVPTSAASPTPIARPTAVPVTPPPAASLPVETETVPAPEPEDITASSAETSVSEPSAQTEDELSATVAASGSWDAVYAWADEHGWSQARTEAWIARLDAKIARERADQDPGRQGEQDPGQPIEDSADRLVNADQDAERRVGTDEDADRQVPPDSPPGQRSDPLVPAEAEKTSERDHSGPPFGSKRERSQVPPD